MPSLKLSVKNAAPLRVIENWSRPTTIAWLGAEEESTATTVAPKRFQRTTQRWRLQNTALREVPIFMCKHLPNSGNQIEVRCAWRLQAKPASASKPPIVSGNVPGSGTKDA